MALEIKKIKCISPSRYYRFKQCQLSELWAMAKNVPIVPVHGNAVLGTIIHNVLEYFSKDKESVIEDFETIWEKTEANVIGKQKDKYRYIPLRINSHYYAPKKNNTKIAIEKLKIRKDSEPNFEGKNEEPMGSTSGKIFGKADLLIRKYEDNEVSLIDFKTGKVLDENGRIKEEYVLQLKLYAILYNHNYKNIFDAVKEWPDNLFIVSNDGTFYPVPYSKEEAASILDEIEASIDGINDIIELGVENLEDRFSTIGPQCRFCTYRPSCSKYINSGDFNNDIIDTVLSIKKNLPANKWVIKFESDPKSLQYYLLSDNDLSMDLDDFIVKKCIITDVNKQDNLPHYISNRFSVLRIIENV